MKSALDIYKEYLLKQEQKRQIEEENKRAKAKLIYLMFELIVSISGLVIVGYQTNRWVVIGLFLVLWGNNMGINRNIFTQKLNLVKKIWSR